MPTEFDVDDLISNSPLTLHPVGQALKQARDAMCGIYVNNPARFQADSQLVPGASQVARDMLDNLCRDKPLPALPPAPFTGGQCECVTYDYDLTSSVDGTSTAIARQSATAPIVGLIYAPTTLSTFPGAQDVFVRATTCTNGKPTAYSDSYKFTLRPGGFAGISNVRRRDNAPDTCGNPERRYPPAPIKNPINFDVNINLNGRIEVRPVIVFAPIILAPKLELNPRFDISIPIKIGEVNFDFSGNKITQRVYNDNDNTTIKTDISAAITQINTNTNTQNTNTQNNVNTNVNNNHASTRTNINNNTNTQTSNVTTNVNNNTNTQTTNAVTNINNATKTEITNNTSSLTSHVTNTVTNATNVINLNTNTNTLNLGTEITNRLNFGFGNIGLTLQGIINAQAELNATANFTLQIVREVRDKPDCPELPPPPDELPVPDEPPADDGGNSPKKPKLAYVEVILTRLPDKMQFGNRGAESVFFAGWIAFRAPTGGYYSREQINFRRSIFVVPQPSGADGYTYTFTHGAKGTIREYYV
jgi:hypothetical protein